MHQRARGSKFSRRPDRSCSVGTVKLVSHPCASAWLVVRRQTGSGLSSARMELYCWVPKSKVRPADLDGRSAGLSVIRGVPSSDTFFQYRSCKLVLASVICRATSFMSFSLNGASLPATDLSYCSENRGTGCKVAWHAY